MRKCFRRKLYGISCVPLPSNFSENCRIRVPEKRVLENIRELYKELNNYIRNHIKSTSDIIKLEHLLQFQRCPLESSSRYFFFQSLDARERVDTTKYVPSIFNCSTIYAKPVKIAEADIRSRSILPNPLRRVVATLKRVTREEARGSTHTCVIFSRSTCAKPIEIGESSTSMCATDDCGRS